MTTPTIDRRGFLSAAAGVRAARRVAPDRLAQAPVTGVRPTGRYADSLIFERKPFQWPGGKTLAVWVTPAVEVWDFDSTVEAALTPGGGPPGLDVINYASRDYGIRVGLSRIVDLLDRAGIRGTAALNSAACDLYPKHIKEMAARRWEFMGHGITNSRTLRRLSVDQERDVIRTSVGTIETATGTKVRGWLSPGQIETSNTPDLLAQVGLSYTCDWSNDDQPYRMEVRGGEVYSIPYGHIINDVELLSKAALTGPQYGQSLVDQFEQLLQDSRKQPRVMGIPVHPFLSGQPDRIGHLERALLQITRADGVWLATGGEIIDAYRAVSS